MLYGSTSHQRHHSSQNQGRERHDEHGSRQVRNALVQLHQSGNHGRRPLHDWPGSCRHADARSRRHPAHRDGDALR